MNNTYNYIIIGAGCAGLSLLMRLLKEGQLSNKNILLLEKHPKTTNDRTWCFWEKEPGFFEDIVYRKWDHINFSSNTFKKQYLIAPYQYKMIRGIDFYNYCLSIISNHAQVTIEYAAVQSFSGANGDTWVQVNNEKRYAEYIFSSIPPIIPPQQGRVYSLMQHFKGWEIETKGNVFDPDVATLMDFRTIQRGGTSFVYTMPLAANRALIEYTLFTDTLLSLEDYNTALTNYISRFYPGIEYSICQEEFGIIPMTNHIFPPNSGSILYIGTAGGQTKPSTGYTFQFIQQHSESLVKALVSGKSIYNAHTVSKKHHWYDSVLLNVLATGKVPGDEVFTILFKNNKPQDIFRFLDNRSTMLQDLRLISTLPFVPFLKAGMQQL